jgi:uncharacterized lipoprotein
MLNKIAVPLFSIFLLAGCATSSNTIEINPKITLPSHDPALNPVTVSINGADNRRDQAVAKVMRDNKVVSLMPSRDLRFLLQEVLEKQMTARGFMVGPTGSVDLAIVVNHLFANVEQGSLRYSIHSQVDISIIATDKKGNKHSKDYRQRYSVEGPFNASNQKIAETVNSALSDVITTMSQDVSLSEFIKKSAK